MKKLLFIFGTRPEAIKLSPLILKCREESSFEVKVCVTAQHRNMLDQVLDFFSIKPDFDLKLMKPDQTLFNITIDGLQGLQEILTTDPADLVIVQGDTTTAFIGALASYYRQIKVAHVEAGLRSGNKYSPFPEEINRKLVSVIADFHFAPTKLAAENLYREGITNNVFTVGNTVVDALHTGLQKIKNDQGFQQRFPFLQPGKKMILITGHRRESFGKGFENICRAILQLAAANKEVQFVYPVHLNPNVQTPVNAILKGLPNVHLIEPVDYPTMVWLMSKSYFILTDSGGIQEEAPSLGKPVLVMRDTTERTEGIDAGTAVLVGTDKDSIIQHSLSLFNDPNHYERMSTAANPYGDGTSSEQIIQILKNSL